MDPVNSYSGLSSSTQSLKDIKINWDLFPPLEEHSAFVDGLSSVKDLVLDHFQKKSLEKSQVLSEEVFDPVTQIRYTKVYNIFPEVILKDAKKQLKELMNDWNIFHKRNKYKTWREENNRHENDVLRSEGCKGYDSFEFGEDHKLISPGTFCEKLTIISETFFKENRDRLLSAGGDLLRLALERFAFEKKLIGTHKLRVQLKIFNMFIEVPLKEPESKNWNLTWHFDNRGDTSMVIPLSNENIGDAPGTILFARNSYDGKCSGHDNVSHSIPDKETITEVPYPEKGGLMFDGQQGAQIHCPSPVTIPANTTGLLAKMLIQIVSYDTAWMEGKK